MSQNTNWGYLVKGNLLNEVTVPRESDGVELAVSKMQVETLVDNPILLGKDVAYTYIDDHLKASIAGSHKSIAGEIEVNDNAEVETIFADYAAGKDLTLSNGRILNNGNASPGEVIYFVPAAGSSWAAEEVVVGSKKEFIILSNNNQATNEFALLEEKVVDNTAALTLVDTSVQVDAKVAVEKAERENDVQSINTAATDLEARVVANETDVDELQITSQIHDEKLREIENAGLLEDKVWIAEAGHELQAADGLDISAIVDQNGNTFDFTAGKRIELIFAKELYEASQDITVDGARAINFAIPLTTNPTGNNIQFQVKLTSAGTLDIKSADNSDLSKVFLIEVRETIAALDASFVYTKTESDDRYATKAGLTAANTAIAGKQSVIDAALQTATKSVVGAINELDGKIKINDPLVARLGGLKTSDGDDLSTTTEALVTDKTISARGYITSAEVDARIAAALSTIMSVTFDDSSTGIFKIGK